jgi:hypothetical protein
MDRLTDGSSVKNGIIFFLLTLLLFCNAVYSAGSPWWNGAATANNNHSIGPKYNDPVGTISNSTSGYVVVGYNKNSTVMAPDQMNISGGTVLLNKFVVGQAGRGILTITGSDASITTNNFYVGNNGSTILNGVGTVKFKVEASGVSAIHARTAVFIDIGNETSTADLIVALLAAPPLGDILFIDNQGTGANGLFDTLNGGSAAEGALVTLSFGGIDYNYALTYTSIAGIDSVANDVMLMIPEPATLVIFAATSLVYLFKRRR